MKRVLTTLIVLLMTLSLSACGNNNNNETTKESVEIFINVPILTVDCVSNPEFESSADFIKAAWDEFAAQYDKYDVSLMKDKVYSFEQTDYAANITDVYGTEKCPDLSFGGYFAMSAYIYDGYIIPLDDIITDEIRNDYSEATWQSSMGNNGKTYLLPFYSLMNIMCFNKDLFAECGLEKYCLDDDIIQGWSLEQWEEVLSALQKKLPDGKFPMMMYAKNNQGDTHTMVILRCMGSNFFNEDGLFNLNTEEGIAGLQWIKDNYDKGYYPKGCEDIAIKDCSDMFNNGQIAIHIWNSALATNYDNMNLGYVNFPGSTNNGANSNWITGFMAFDNGDEKKVEVVKDFLTYIYTHENTLNYQTSGLPCAKSVQDRYADQLALGEQLALNDQYSVNFTANNPNWPAVRQAFWPHIHALLAGTETAAQAAQGLDNDCNNAIKSANRQLHD